MKVWNIGSDGQFLAGALVACGIGIKLDAPGWLLLVLMAVGSIVGGALWIAITAAARAHWGVNEIITTLLLNFVAVQLVVWASLGFWRDNAAQVTQSTESVPVTLPRIPGFDSVSIGFFVPLILSVVLWAVFRSTKVGYEIDTIGGNPRAAAFAGIDVRRRMIVVMLVSGAIAGLGGFLQLTGAPGAQALNGGGFLAQLRPLRVHRRRTRRGVVPRDQSRGCHYGDVLRRYRTADERAVRLHHLRRVRPGPGRRHDRRSLPAHPRRSRRRATRRDDRTRRRGRLVMLALIDNTFLSLVASAIPASTVIVLYATGVMLNERVGVLNLGQEGLIGIGAVFAVIGVQTLGHRQPVAGPARRDVRHGVHRRVLRTGTVVIRANQVLIGLALALGGVGLANQLGTGRTDRRSRPPASSRSSTRAAHSRRTSSSRPS